MVDLMLLPGEAWTLGGECGKSSNCANFNPKLPEGGEGSDFGVV